MNGSFLALLWRSFPTSRPVDWQLREAGKLFLRALERDEQIETLSTSIAQLLRRAAEDRSSKLLEMAPGMIAGLAAFHERSAEDLRRSTELFESVEIERELASLDRLAMARRGAA